MKHLYNIKPIFLVFFALIVYVMPVKAQFTDDLSKSPEERAQILTNWMQENLKLSDSQLPEIRSINRQAAVQMENARTEFGKDMEGFLARGREIDKEHNIKLRTALSPIQWSKYQKFRDGTALKKDRKKDKSEKVKVAQE